jgi:hypothetical protein
MLRLLVLTLLTGCAHVDELAVGIGKGFTLGEDGVTGGVASASARFDGRWEARFLAVGPQTIYERYGGLKQDGFWSLQLSRYWDFRDGHSTRPELGLGALFREQAECRFNGDEDCNRQVPRWLSACEWLGVTFTNSYLRTDLGHCSNNAFDTGPEAKNLGFNYGMLDVILWRR